MEENDDRSYPAPWFERLFGLSGIGVRWVMLGGKSMKEMEDQLLNEGLLNRYGTNGETVIKPEDCGNAQQVAAKLNEAQKYARIFIDLNPALQSARFDPDDWEQLKGFLWGVTSGLNVDDINAWNENNFDRAMIGALRRRIADEYQKEPENSWYPQALREQFQKVSGPQEIIAAIRWVPSAQTIGKINDQLDQKERVRHTPVSKPG